MISTIRSELDEQVKLQKKRRHEKIDNAMLYNLYKGMNAKMLLKRLIIKLH